MDNYKVNQDGQHTPELVDCDDDPLSRSRVAAVELGPARSAADKKRLRFVTIDVGCIDQLLDDLTEARALLDMDDPQQRACMQKLIDMSTSLQALKREARRPGDVQDF